MTTTFMRRLLAAAGTALLLAGPALGDCQTDNCGAASSPPAACAQQASVRTPRVLLTGSFPNFVFEPADPRIEPGGCVEWAAGSVGHSSTADNCADLSNAACTSGSPDPACLWETGNVSSSGPDVQCHYDALSFLANSAEGYYCRPHSSPAHSGSMFGTLRITNPIALNVEKAGGDVLLSWSGGDGGGVTPAARRFRVLRDTNDPQFTGLVDQFTPDGGIGGTSYEDTGEAGNTTDNRFYLVVHRQTNE